MRKLVALSPYEYLAYSESGQQQDIQFVERFYNLLTRSVNPPFAISVDDLWGAGKTTIMKLLQKKLNKEGYPTFWFNPWEYRSTESVVLAFLKSLAGQYPDLFDGLPDKGGRFLQVLLKSGMNAALDILTMKTVSLKDVESYMTEAEKAQKTSYQEFSDSVQTLKKEFQALIGAISRKYSGNPIIIFSTIWIAVCRKMRSNCWKRSRIFL